MRAGDREETCGGLPGREETAGNDLTCGRRSVNQGGFGRSRANSAPAADDMESSQNGSDPNDG